MKNLLLVTCIFMIANMGTAQAYNMGGMDAGAINRQYVKDMRIHEIQSRPNKKNSAIVQPKTALQERTIPDVTAYIKTINFYGTIDQWSNYDFINYNNAKIVYLKEE